MLERSAVPFGAVPCRATLQRASHGSLKGSADLGNVVWALQHVVLCCNMLYCVATRCDAMQALQSETELTLLESDSNVAIISHSPIDDANGNRLVSCPLRPVESTKCNLATLQQRHHCSMRR